MIIYSQCPACGSNHIEFSLNVQDHSISHESFEVFQCATCSFRFTQRIPEMHEIGKYYQSIDYISHTNSKKGVFNFTYQIVRSFTLRNKRKLIEKITLLKKGKILDYGCGTGAFLNEMRHAGWDITGIEPDPGAREKAASLNRTEIKSTDALSHFQEESLDVITLWHVLEHIHSLDETILNLKKALKKNGTMIIAVPNFTSADSEFYGSFWAAYDVPRHLYHFSPASMDSFLTRMGLKVNLIKPMWFDSFYVSLLSEKYLKGNSNVLRAFYIGLKSNLRALFNKKRCSSLIYIAHKSS